MRASFLRGARDGVPICLGYVSVAFVFGMMCVESGLSPLMAALISIAMCGQPIGQAVYGVLFDIFAARAWVVLVGAAAAAALISAYSKKIFRRLGSAS